MSRAKKQMFFKVFLLEHSARRMKIPPAFRRHMKERNSRTVYLTGHSGNCWLVKLIEESGQLYLAQGWPSFVKDHTIRHGHFLVFKYDGVDTFKVRVFCPSGCEEKAALCTKPSPANDCGRHECGKELVLKMKDEEDTSSRAEKGLLQAPSVAATYPFFVVHLRGYNIVDRSSGMTVGIPISFFRIHMSHFVKQTTRILLRWKDNEWPATVTRTGRRVHLCEGWQDFVRQSKVRAGDSCKFELLGRLILHVHIKPVKRV